MMRLTRIYFLFCLGISGSENNGSNNYQKIRSALLANYDKQAFPHDVGNDTTIVEVGLSVHNVRIDEDAQIFSIFSFISYFWKDGRLKWDHEDYGKIETVRFGNDELWKPDLVAYNIDDSSEIDHYGKVNIVVANDGTVTWIPPASFNVYCPLDLTLWPYDQHVCKINIGSWAASGFEIDLKLTDTPSGIDFLDFSQSTNKWKIVKSTQVKTSLYYQCCPEPYVNVKYTFELRRNFPSFVTTIMIPAIVLPLFLLIQFILPVDHPKRLTMGFVCSFLFFLEMLYLKTSLPKLGTSVPLIVCHCIVCFVTSIFAVVLNAILARLVHPQDPKLAFPLPQFLKRALTGPLATVLCLRYHANKVELWSKVKENAEALDDNKVKSYFHEWLLLAKVIDRICFPLFISVFLILFIRLSTEMKFWTTT